MATVGLILFWGDEDRRKGGLFFEERGRGYKYW